MPSKIKKSHHINSSESKIEKVKQDILKWKILQYKQEGNYIELSEWIKAAQVNLADFGELVRIFDNAFHDSNSYWQPDEPTRPVGADKVDLELFKIKYTAWLKECSDLKSNHTSMFTEMMAHLSEESKEELRCLTTWETDIFKNRCPLKLLNAVVKLHTAGAVSMTKAQLTNKALKDYNNNFMGANTTPLQYYQKHKEFISAIKTVDSALTPSEECQAVQFIDNLDPVRYKDLLLDVQNSIAKGEEGYPSTMEDAWMRVKNWKGVRPSGKIESAALVFSAKPPKEPPLKPNTAKPDEDDKSEKFGKKKFKKNKEQKKKELEEVELPKKDRFKKGKESHEKPEKKVDKKMKCYLCKENHYSSDCPLKAEVEDLVESLKKKKSGATSLFVSAKEAEDYDIVVPLKGPSFLKKNTVSHNIKVLFATDFDQTQGQIFSPDDVLLQENEGCNLSEEKLSTDFIVPQGVEDDKISLIMEYFAKGKKNSENYLVLDNGASICGCYNSKFFPEPLEDTDNPVSVKGISSEVEVSKQGKLFGEEVFALYDPSFLANILSWSYLVSKNIIIDWYQQENKFVVHFPAYGELIFQQYKGLYVRDCTDIVNGLEPEIVMTQVTVEENQELFTKQEVARADRARSFIEIMGFPSLQTAVKMVPNCVNNDVTSKDLHRAKRIYGPEIAAIKGKAVKKVNKRPISSEYVDRPLQKLFQILFLDIMFINKVMLLFGVLWPLRLKVVGHIKSKKAATLLGSVGKLLAKIKKFGFGVSAILIDGEKGISAISDLIVEKFGVKVDPKSSGDHVAVVERGGRTVKDCCRSVISVLRFALTITLTAFLALYVVEAINWWPTIDSQVSPNEQAYGRKWNKLIDGRGAFGSYCESVDPYGDNTMKSRTESSILLYPVGNLSGSYIFLNLESFKLINRSQFEVMPVVPPAVISIMNDRAKRDGVLSKDLVVSINPPDEGPIEDVDDALQRMEVEEDEYLDKDIETQDITELRTLPEDYGKLTENEEQIQEAMDQVHMETRGRPRLLRSFRESSLNNPENDAVELPPPTPPELLVQESADQITSSPNIDNNDNPSRYSLRSQGGLNLAHSQDVKLLTINEDYAIFNLKIKEALKKHGRASLVSLIEEIYGIHELKTLTPVEKKRLSNNQLRKIIRSKYFLKEKLNPHSGEFLQLKSRLVAGGDMQDRTVYEDISSPTVTLQSVFMIASLAAREKRKVVTADIGKAYLNAEMTGEEVLMEVDSLTALILSKIDPQKYSQFIDELTGKMIVRLDKALYGCIESARLWYFTLKEFLEDKGFTSNPEDICVFNKGIGKKQITIAIYVDDLFITSRNEWMIKDLISQMKERFSEVKVTEGDTHNYLGMTFDFSKENKVKVTMNTYVEEMLKEWEVTGKASSPALSNLFEVRDDAEVLTDGQQLVFHSRIAKVLYLAKRVRPDLLVANIFLATRVNKATIDDWWKLDRLLKYINDTKSLGIVLEADELISVIAFIDASFAVHPDAKSHTGTFISVGKGPVFAKSGKQKLMSKSSTESELIGLSDSFPQVIWTRNFLIAQGYNLEPCTVYQDNMSTIAMVKKGRSTSERTRHINIRFFFIKDKIDNGELVIEHMPTEDMIADILTKPLQGELFRQLRSKLLNWYEN